MFVGRANEIDIILKKLSSDRESSGASSIIAAYGLFGAGKTTLLRRIRDRVEDEALADAVFFLNEDVNATSSLPEFAYHLATTFQSLDPAIHRLSTEELDLRRRRYLEISGRLGADTMPLFHKLRSERLKKGSGEEHNKVIEAEILALEIAVKNQFNNQDDQRLTLDTGNVVAEAFIVDLMSTFYPLAEEVSTLETYLERQPKPRKLIIIIDTYEKITSVLNPWLLESLLPFLYEKRFGDFRSYRTPYLPDGIHVRNFFDVRFVIAGRERLSLTDMERRWDRHRDSMVELHIRQFTTDELRNYLHLSGFEPDVHLDTVMALTQGLPYLVSLWVDAMRAGERGTEPAFVNALAEQRIFWYKTPEQRTWIRAAAFLDWFDADALQCFPGIGKDAPKAFEYLRNTSEVARPSQSRPAKFELHGIIQSALREATGQESEDTALAFKEAAGAFYDAYDLLASFDTAQRRHLRRLAYFARFDTWAIEHHFGGEAHLVRDLLAEGEGLFEKGERTTTMKPAPAKRLKRYNRAADRDEYAEIVEELRSLWKARKAELERQIEERRERIRATEAEIRHAAVERKTKAELRTKAGESLGGLQAEFNYARNRRQRGLSPREVVVARTSFFFLCFFGLIVLFASSIPVDQESQGSIRTAALALTILFLGIFSLMLGRILYNRSKRNEMKELRDDVSSVEERLSKKQYEYHTLGAEAEGADVEIDTRNELIVQLQAEISELELRLQEPYV